MATDSPVRPAVATGFPLTTPQLVWLTAQAAVLLGVAAFQGPGNSELARAFLSDALGVKLTILAALLAAANFAALLGGWRLLRDAGMGRAALTVGCFLFLYLPAVFVLLIGPAAVHLRAVMLAP